ncbi:MAG TPA: hypothetical protein VEZ44_01260 [bacterium]|nr:hypothetical protein [bacterium]
MYVVVNRLPLAKPIDDALLAKINSEFIPGARTRPGFRSLQLVRNSDTDAIVIVHFETLEAAGRISQEYAAPWFREHFMPYLSGPSTRTVGELVAGGPA